MKNIAIFGGRSGGTFEARRARKSMGPGIAVGVVMIYHRFVRPWHERWGAAPEEVTGSLPGDDLIAEPATQVTRAISIRGPAAVVWPWVIQIGADRGGFYSYDWLENLFGLDIHSANDIGSDWESRAVGDLVYAEAKGRGGWYVMDVQPDRALVLQTADVKNARPATRANGAFMEFTWAFVLHEKTDGTIRLIVRERVALRYQLARFVMAPIALVSFVMTQKMLRGIKRRVESRIRVAAAPVQVERKAAG
jgi:hypothetical protein